VVWGPIKTTIGLSAAVQEGFLGWDTGRFRGFRVATGKAVVFEISIFYFFHYLSFSICAVDWEY
jgi:hypothetical protein